MFSIYIIYKSLYISFKTSIIFIFHHNAGAPKMKFYRSLKIFRRKITVNIPGISIFSSNGVKSIMIVVLFTQLSHMFFLTVYGFIFHFHQNSNYHNYVQIHHPIIAFYGSIYLENWVFNVCCVLNEYLLGYLEHEKFPRLVIIKNSNYFNSVRLARQLIRYNYFCTFENHCKYFSMHCVHVFKRK